MSTIIHAVAGYFILLLVVRVLKRRAGSQMTLFEFVLIFLMGGIIILSTVGNDRSVTNCTCAVIAVGLMHRALSWLKLKNARLGMIVDGTPLVVIKGGETQDEVVRGMSLRPEDLEAASRSAQVKDKKDIDYRWIESHPRCAAPA